MSRSKDMALEVFYTHSHMGRRNQKDAGLERLRRATGDGGRVLSTSVPDNPSEEMDSQPDARPGTSFSGLQWLVHLVRRCSSSLGWEEGRQRIIGN